MLKYMHIRGFAVVEEIELELSDGLTVFTGETGAGKSVIVDALTLILGNRSDSEQIRSGCDQAVLSACFSITPATREKLADLDLDAGLTDEVHIRRIIRADQGRSRAYINEQPVPLRTLRAIGNHLTSIQGQHAYHNLLDRDHQRELLDNYGDYDDTLAAVSRHHRQYQKILQQMRQWQEAAGNAQQAELLRYQVQELDELSPTAEEYDQLGRGRQRLAGLERLLNENRRALTLLNDDEGAASQQTHEAKRILSDLAELAPELEPLATLLEEAAIRLDETCAEIRRWLNKAETDPQQLEQIEEKLRRWHEVTRKHRIQPEQLPEHWQQLRDQLHALNTATEQRADYEQQQKAEYDLYQKAAADLSKARLQAAAALSAQVDELLHRLGLPQGRFTVELMTKSREGTHQRGDDEAEFIAMLNPGLPAQPLRKVASGGELARICLALHTCAPQSREAPTLVFDEVDSGVGGAVAEQVGQLLRRLAAGQQVLCITHLPQVAALGNHHMRVDKQTDGQQTRVAVRPLQEPERIEEIARMLGGMKITHHTQQHAEAMLGAARNNGLSE